MLTKNAVGNLINRYRSVLANCRLLNAFGSLALATALVTGAGVGNAHAAYDTTPTLSDTNIITNITNNISGLTIAIPTSLKNANQATYTDWDDYASDVNPLLTAANVSSAYAVEVKDSTKTYDTTFSVLNANGTTTEYGITFDIPDAPNTPTVVKYGNRKEISEGTTVDSISEPCFSEAKIVDERGGVIYNKGTVTSITANFIKNSLDSHTGGAAIYNYKGTIGTIKGDFFENTVIDNSGGAIDNSTGSTITTIIGNFIRNSTNNGSGGAIYNNGTIGTITGNFFENTATKFGSAIYNDQKATITSITGHFVGNTGAVSLYNTGIINTIVGDFMKNEGKMAGGGIYNFSGDTIGSITGDFIGNTVTSDSTSNGLGSGGGICNRGIIPIITGDFIQNEVSNYGGALYNTETIDTFTGDFIANTAGKKGGAIFNDDTIKIITGNFIQNTSNGTTEGDGGGAIYNTGTISSITGDFIGNTAKTSGGAIYNTGNITFSAANGQNYQFTNNVAGTDYNAIYSSGGTITFSMAGGSSFTMNDSITCVPYNSTSTTISITGDTTATDTEIFNLNDEMKGATVTVSNATLTLGTHSHTDAKDSSGTTLTGIPTFGSLGDSSVGLTNSSTLTVDIGTYSASTGALTTNETSTLTISSGTLSITGESTLSGTTTVNDGTLSLTDDSTLSGATTVEKDGTLKIDASGKTVAAANITTATDANLTIENGTLSITGESTLSGSTNVNGSSTLAIASGTNTVTAAKINTVATDAQLTITNGTLQLTGESTLGGTTSVNGGTLELNTTSNTSTTASNLHSAKDANLKITQGTLELTGDSNTLLAGDTTIGDATNTGALDITGSNKTFTGAVTVKNGMLNAKAKTTFSGTTSIEGGTLTVTDTGTGTTFSTTNISGGVLNANGTTTFSGTTTISGGMLNVTGTGSSFGITNINSGGTLNVNAETTFGSSLGGTTTISGGMLNVNAKTTFSAPTNIEGGTLNVTANDTKFATVTVSGTDANNYGTLCINKADITTTATRLTLSGGALNVTNGTLDVSGTNTLAFTDNTVSTITIGTSGTLTADLEDFGTLNDTTFTKINDDDYTLTNNGTLSLLTSGTVHRLKAATISNNIATALNGTVEVTGWTLEGLYSLNTFVADSTGVLDEQVMAGTLENGETLTARGIVGNTVENGASTTTPSTSSIIEKGATLTLTGASNTDMLATGNSLTNNGILNLSGTGTDVTQFSGELISAGETNVTSRVNFLNGVSITGGTLNVTGNNTAFMKTTITAGTLNVTGDNTSFTNITLNGADGTLNVNANANATTFGATTISGGTLNVNAETTFGSLGGTTTISGGELNINAATTFSAPTNISNTGTLNANAATTFSSTVNISSGTLNAKADGTMFNSALTVEGGTFAVNASGGTVTTKDINFTSGALNVAAGTLDVTSGTLSVASGATVTIAENGTLKAASSNFGTLTKDGTFTANTTDILGKITNSGALTLTGLDTANIFTNNIMSKAAKYNWTSTDTWTNFFTDGKCGTVYLDGITTDGHYSLTYVDTADNLVIGGNDTVMAGTLSGKTVSFAGIIENTDITSNTTTSTIASGAVLTLTGANSTDMLATGTLTNNGTLNLSGDTFSGELISAGITNVDSAVNFAGTTKVSAGELNVNASNTTFDNITVSGGELNVNASKTTFDNITVSGGNLSLWTSGTTFDNTTISGGNLNINSYASNTQFGTTTISGGDLHVGADGTTLDNTTVSDGYLYVNADGTKFTSLTVSGTDANSLGRLVINEADTTTTVTNLTLSGGAIKVMAGTLDVSVVDSPDPTLPAVTSLVAMAPAVTPITPPTLTLTSGSITIDSGAKLEANLSDFGTLSDSDSTDTIAFDTFTASTAATGITITNNGTLTLDGDWKITIKNSEYAQWVTDTKAALVDGGTGELAFKQIIRIGLRDLDEDAFENATTTLTEKVMHGDLDTGTFTATGITANGEADTDSVIGANATVTLTGQDGDGDGTPDYLLEGGSITNNGTLLLGDGSHANTVTLQYDGALTNTKDVTVQDNINITGAVVSSGTTDFEDTATLTSLEVTDGATTFKDTATITGATEITGGKLNFEDDATFTGGLTATGGTTDFGTGVAGHTITISGAVTNSGTSTMTFKDNATLNDTLTVAKGSTTFNGTANITGLTKVTDGTLDFEDAATLTSLEVAGGTTTFKGTTTVNTTTMTGGQIAVAGADANTLTSATFASMVKGTGSGTGSVFVENAYTQVTNGLDKDLNYYVGNNGTLNAGAPLDSADLAAITNKMNLTTSPVGSGFVSTGNAVFVHNTDATLNMGTGSLLVGTDVDKDGQVGGATVAQNVYFGKNANLIVNVANFAPITDGNTTTTAVIDGGGTATIAVDSTAKLGLSQVKSGTYTILDNFASSGNTAWTEDQVFLLNPIYGVTNTLNEDGTYTVTIGVDKYNESFANVTPSTQDFIVQVLENDDENTKVIGPIMEDPNIPDADKAKAVEQATSGFAGSIVTAAYTITTGAQDVITTQISSAISHMNETPASTGRLDASDTSNMTASLDLISDAPSTSYIDEPHAYGIQVWAMPFYQRHNTSGLKTNSSKTDSDNNFSGMVLGADKAFGDWRVGLAINAGLGGISSKTDYTSTDTDYNFFGANLYAGRVFGDFGFTAQLGYSHGNYESQVLTTTGISQEADMASHTYAASVRGTYDMSTSFADITPFVGLSFMHFILEDYDLVGTTVGSKFTVVTEDQDVWSVPFGVVISKDFVNDGGWTLTPALELGGVYADGDLRAHSTTYAAGATGNPFVAESVDQWTLDAGLHLGMSKDVVNINVGYDVQVSEHMTNHGVFARIGYDF